MDLNGSDLDWMIVVVDVAVFDVDGAEFAGVGQDFVGDDDDDDALND
jgi:hypothetical protein